MLAFRNFCGAYDRGLALYEWACRHVFSRVENDALPVGAGWCENAIQQSEETPGMRACDEEERDRKSVV